MSRDQETTEEEDARYQRLIDKIPLRDAGFMEVPVAENVLNQRIAAINEAIAEPQYIARDPDEALKQHELAAGRTWDPDWREKREKERELRDLEARRLAEEAKYAVPAIWVDYTKAPPELHFIANYKAAAKNEEVTYKRWMPQRMMELPRFANETYVVSEPEHLGALTERKLLPIKSLKMVAVDENGRPYAVGDYAYYMKTSPVPVRITAINSYGYMSSIGVKPEEDGLHRGYGGVPELFRREIK